MNILYTVEAVSNTLVLDHVVDSIDSNTEFAGVLDQRTFKDALDNCCVICIEVLNNCGRWFLCGGGEMGVKSSLLVYYKGTWDVELCSLCHCWTQCCAGVCDNNTVSREARCNVSDDPVTGGP